MFTPSYKLRTTSCRGFTLIESLVFLFIFALISTVFLQTYSVGTRLIIESKNRLGATALANQKMEVVRSIDYTVIGTTTGIPAGDLLEDETISVNTVKYQVHTFVQYADDAFDGQSPTDTVATDYKRVRITVSWGNGGSDQQAAIFGNFSPNGVETSGGGGTLSINVLDSTGSGVSGAAVHIVNSAEGVDVTTSTDSTGNITLPGTPAGTENYALTVSKSGYYGASTYPPYPTSSYDPLDVHASVVDSALNQKSIVMDQEVDLVMRTEDPFGTAIPDISYTLSGGRPLGTDVSTGDTVYGFNETGTTDASGEASYPGESYGRYTVTVSDPDYTFWKTSPAGDTADIFDAVAGAGTFSVVLLDESIGSVQIAVTDQADSSPIEGASVTLSNTTFSYSATLTTDAFGTVYFPETLPELVAGTYDISVSLSGYGTETSTVDINGVLETKAVSMTAN